jgi:glycosyltransferase involved in cell wall biosynthesis
MSATHDSAGQVSVSIGIPFFNARPYLADAVRSVFAQTHEDWELILMDDGSTDGSLDVVRQLDDERVRLVSDGTNHGLCARLNQIAALAQGKYLARMDADDLMHPERIERQLRLLDEYPDIDVVDTATFTVDDDLTPLGIRADKPLDCAPVSVLQRGLLMHPTVMGRTDWFRRNPYDPVYVRAEDCELWCRTCTTTRFARIGKPLLFYREGMRGNLRKSHADLRSAPGRLVADIHPGRAIPRPCDVVSRSDDTRNARGIDQAAQSTALGNRTAGGP